MTVRTLGPNGFGTYDFDVATGTLLASEVSDAPLVVPGFVDIHIHGAFGIDFMSATLEQMRSLSAHLQAVGYEAYLPTTVTASAAAVASALRSLPEDGVVAGFHLEGPFISSRYPGAQPPSFIISPPSEPSEWDEILADPRLRVVTLAPELPGALALIERLCQRGVVVSMGHTNATFAEAKVGFASGVRDATHTFNAMRPLHHREAGSVGFALSEDGLNTELIYDRLHVAPEAARLLVKSKPSDRVIAVSDSTLASGIAPGQTIQMWGLEAIVGNGSVRLPDGTLAGSAITLLDAFRNLYADFGPETAIRACSINPRRVLKMIDPPRRWVQFNDQLEIEAIYARS